jgi:putative transposase
VIVDSFNLPAPCHFSGLQPDIPVTMYQRHMPHWRQLGATYFVTFRLADALPQSKLDELRQWREVWERQHPAPRSEEDWLAFAREHTIRTEVWLDEGYGECLLRSPALAQLVADAFLHFQDERYFMSCFVVMPNHCHVVVKPLEPFDLEAILRSWKGYVGLEVNKRLNRHGVIWQEESYDRIVRDEGHLYRVVQYIGRNPAKAGLPREQWVQWIHPDWQVVGWDFHDPET